VRPDDLQRFAGHTTAGFVRAAERSEAVERLERVVEPNHSLLDKGFLALAVEVDGEVVGHIQARAPRFGFPPGVCELGITLFPEARGQGYGTEAVRLFTAHLFSEGWVRVQAATSVTNNGMRRVLERSGYGFEGVLRKFAPGDVTGREDYVLYAALAP
jgi:RimJ/RimL family protein N-acetyltransferase